MKLNGLISCILEKTCREVRNAGSSKLKRETATVIPTTEQAPWIKQEIVLPISMQTEYVFNGRARNAEEPGKPNHGWTGSHTGCAIRCCHCDNIIVPGEYFGISDSHDSWEQLNTVTTNNDVTIDGYGVVDVDTSALRLTVVPAIQLLNNDLRLCRKSPSDGPPSTTTLSGLATQPGLETSR
jgi:hypothetical protein